MCALPQCCAQWCRGVEEVKGESDHGGGVAVDLSRECLALVVLVVMAVVAVVVVGVGMRKGVEWGVGWGRVVVVVGRMRRLCCWEW